MPAWPTPLSLAIPPLLDLLAHGSARLLHSAQPSDRRRHLKEHHQELVSWEKNILEGLHKMDYFGCYYSVTLRSYFLFPCNIDRLHTKTIRHQSKKGNSQMTSLQDPGPSTPPCKQFSFLCWPYSWHVWPQTSQTRACLLPSQPCFMTPFPFPNALPFATLYWGPSSLCLQEFWVGHTPISAITLVGGSFMVDAFCWCTLQCFWW